MKERALSVPQNPEEKLNKGLFNSRQAYILIKSGH